MLLSPKISKIAEMPACRITELKIKFLLNNSLQRNRSQKFYAHHLTVILGVVALILANFTKRLLFLENAWKIASLCFLHYQGSISNFHFPSYHLYKYLIAHNFKFSKFSIDDNRLYSWYIRLSKMYFISSYESLEDTYDKDDSHYFRWIMAWWKTRLYLALMKFTCRLGFSMFS